MPTPSGQSDIASPTVAVVDAPSEAAPVPGYDELLWTDARQRPWRILAGPDALELRSQGTVIQIDRANWGRDLHVSTVGERIVVRFQGDQQEVGFIVSADQLARLMSGLGFKPDEPAVARTDVNTAPRPVDRPMWPVVTRTSVWSLICAALAFLPAVGLLFGFAAIGLVAVFYRRTRRTAALRHARWMAGIALAWALVGMAVSVLAAWSMVSTQPGWILPAPASRWAEAAAGIFVIVMSLSVHEAAHAITAWWLGDDYAKSQGRVTFNPLAHLHPFGSLLLPLLLVQAGMAPFGFARPVPVQLGNIRHFRRAHVLISIAGPGSNLLQAALAMMLLVAIGCLLPRLAPGAKVDGLSYPGTSVLVTGCTGHAVWTAILLVLKSAFVVNVLLAAFNLIPIPPLDGSWVVENFFPRTLGRLYEWIRPYGFLLFLGLVYFRDVRDVLMRPGIELIWWGYHLLWQCTGT